MPNTRRQQADGRLQLGSNSLNGFVRFFTHTPRAVPEFDQFPLIIAMMQSPRA